MSEKDSLSSSSGSFKVPSIRVNTDTFKSNDVERKINFTVYEKLFCNPKLISDSPIEELVSFPKGDLEIAEIKRQHRTEKSSIPEQLVFKKNESTQNYIHDTIQFFSSPYKTIKKNSVQFTNNATPLSIDPASLPEQFYLIDYEEEKNTKAEDFILELLKPETEEAKKMLQSLRSKDRFNLFHVFYSPESVVPLDPRKSGSPWEESFGTQFMLEVKELAFELGPIEPFFGSISLYDIKKKQKISENFNFDINPDSVVSLLGYFQGKREPSTLANKALFSLSYTSPDIYLVVTINIVLRGEDDVITEPYYKGSSFKPKDKSKLEQEIKENSHRLGQFRQTFCCGVFQLFEEKNGVNVLREKAIEIKQLTKLKGDIYSHIIEIEKDKGKQKIKTIPGRLLLDIERVSQEMPGRLDPSLKPVKPVPSTLTPENIIKEIRELKQDEHSIQTNLSYVNELYFYPESLNFNNYSGAASARNIAVEVKLLAKDDNPEADGLPLIYGKSTSSAMTTAEASAVQYHNKKPKFNDEIKIEIPPECNEGTAHHILVTFYHIQCSVKKGKADRVQTPLGYCAIPLFEGGKIISDGIRMVPVAHSLPQGYLDSKIQDNIKWISDHKPLFQFRTKLVSTIHTQDDSLISFFKNANPTTTNESALLDCLQNLPKAQLHALVQFFPTIMRFLLRIICNAPTGLAEEGFNTMLSVVDTIYAATNQSSFLESYITYVFDNEPKCITYDHITRIWVGLLQKSSKANDTFRYCWFLFSIITKSMALELISEGKIESKPRTHRFPEGFIDRLKKLVVIISKDVVKNSTTGYFLAKFLNVNVALFVKDLLSLTDLGNSFEIISQYVQELSGAPVLVDIKFGFLKILIDHEHYVPLNLPNNTDKIESPADLRDSFWQSHFLAGLLLAEIEDILTQESELRIKGIECLRFIMQKHDFDSRYASKQHKHAIAGIYFPYIATVINNIDTIRKTQIYERKLWLICFLYVLRNSNRKLLRDWWRKESQKTLLGFFQAIALCLDTFDYPGKQKIAEDPFEFHDPENEYAEESDAEDRTKRLKDSASDKKDKKKLPIKRTAISNSPTTAPNRQLDARELLESFYHKSSAERMNARKMQGQFRAWRSNSTASGSGSSFVMNRESLKGFASLRDSHMEQNLFREICLVILDAIVEFMKDFKEEMLKKDSIFINQVFGTFILMLKKNLCTSFLSYLYAVLSFVVNDFKRPLFRYPNVVLSDIVYEVLRYSNTKAHITRAEACSLLYLMISGNYKEMKNFSRMKLQFNIAISKLVGSSSQARLDLDNLKKSLQVVAKRSKERHPKEKSLGSQVEEMVSRLFGVIRDSLKMNDINWDPERMMELFYQISLGYLDSPDLRVTWLENLASYHSKLENYEEFAQTKLVEAALVAGYLQVLNRYPKEFPSDFSAVFPNLQRDLVFPPASSLSSLQHEICQSRMFSDIGFIDLLKQAIGMLRVGQLYEPCIEVYNLLLPIYQKRRDYEKQASCYTDLAQLCKIVVDENQVKQRLFSNYYRVAFFGVKYEEFDGTEWVYKEPPSVRVPDISERLQNQFGKKFGMDKVHILPNTKVVNKSELDKDHLYLQIISVDVYLPPEELVKRETLYEQNFNINRFIFETPFTKSGKAQGGIEEQYKRKIILTVDGFFPDIKKRLKVLSKTELVVTPIETAIELIQKKTVSLKAELSTATPNLKSLQMGLQGSLLMQVNAGPLEVCRVFLGDNMTKYYKPHTEKLMDAMNEFVATLSKALAVHQGLIKTDQLILQKELEQGFRFLQGEVQKYMQLRGEEDDQSSNFAEDGQIADEDLD